MVVAAKVFGTAVVARLFALTKPALLRMPRCAAGSARWVAFKAELLAAAVRASWVRRSARVMQMRLRRRWPWR